MLPLQLLRVTTRKGTIRPQLCGDEDELLLAERIIQEVSRAHKNGETRAELETRITAIESDRNLGNDFKLVRGLYALLERRCAFRVDKPVDSTGRALEPQPLRRAVFEESAKRGFALTDLERREIALAGAQSLGFELQRDTAAETVQKAMFCDLEENQVVSAFEQIEPSDLVGWYNLALMQTLLFNCTKMEFSVSGGQNWKRVLRRMKWLGLMYGLEEKGEASSNAHAPAEAGTVRQSGQTSNITCNLDGPLSLFKMTDKYGTAIAKVLPDIVRSERWSVHAWIVRKTMSGKKLYEFHSTDSDVPKNLFDPYAYPENAAGAGNRKQTSTPQGLKIAINKSSAGPSQYDSSVEEKFAKKVAQSSLPEAGWKLEREPDPLLVPGGGVIIPDFLFEKNGRKVYVEIVGFWTKEYLEKKTRKIIDLLGEEGQGTSRGQRGGPLELFLAVNEELACSKMASSIPRGRLIFYRNDSVPIGPIIEYLKSVDREILRRGSSDPELRVKISTELEGSTRDIIAIAEIARKHDISQDLATDILGKREQDNYIISGNFLISKGKAKFLADLLEGISRFAEASSVLSANSIPEDCHAELVDKLGYSVVWKSIEPDSAVVVKRKPIL